MIVPAALGTELMVTAKLEAVPLPHVFVGVTVTFPDVEPAVTVILVVLSPAVMVDPVGTFQV